MHVMILAVRTIVPAGLLPAAFEVSVVGLLQHAAPEGLHDLLDLPAIEHLQPAQLSGTSEGNRQEQPAAAYEDASHFMNGQGKVALIRLPEVGTSRVKSAVIETDMLQRGNTDDLVEDVVTQNGLSQVAKHV